ncbi:MAG: substrate-binding domain-containing protein [Candidatus Binatia bacterium]
MKIIDVHIVRINGKPGSFVYGGGAIFERRQILQLISSMVMAAVLILTMAARLRAETIKLGGTGGSLATMQRLADAFKKEQPADEVQIVTGLGGKGSKKALLGGALDISVMTTVGNAAETPAGLAVKEFAKAPYAFDANAKVKVGSVTLKDLVEIYGGRRITWPNGERLRLILRSESNVDTEVLKSVSAAMAAAVKNALKREGMSVAANDHESADLIETIPGAIGTNMLPLVVAEKRALKVLPLDGVTPSAKAIANGSYPWFKTYHLLTKATPPPHVQRFVSFVFSAKGRQLVAPYEYWLPKSEVK